MLAKKSLIIVTVFIMILALPVSALAGSATIGGVTVTFPDSYVSCNPSDLITVTGVTGPTTINFFRWDSTTNIMYKLGSVTTSQDGSFPFPYPQVTGTMWFTVGIVVGGIQGGGKWSVTCEVAGNGCTPGYWRQPQHYDEWLLTPYRATDIFDNVFGTSYFNQTFTLWNAIWDGGGGIHRLARHGTAALLSASHPFVDYPYTVAEVIAMVQSGTIDPLAQANEMSCPLH